WIWTGDKLEDKDGSEVAWFILFFGGLVNSHNYFSQHYVRPVRSVYDSDEELCKPRIITLRSSYKALSVSQVHSMPNVSRRRRLNRGGFSGHSTINHDYNLKTIRGEKVVVDNATGLMWHQSGSDDEMNWGDAKEWVEHLNSKEGYAGYRDWRLPTVEEAASLLEPSKKICLEFRHGYKYTDTVFSIKQWCIWTGDKLEDIGGSEVAWYVDLSRGHVRMCLIIFSCYVRTVRSVYVSDEELRKPKIITLRTSYKTLSVSKVQSMPNVSIREKDDWGFCGHSTINRDCNLKTIGGDKVVVANATGLMWHQSGSDDEMIWDDVKEWVEDLNSEEGYAGYHDWRLPTVNEVASLLEARKSSMKNGKLYIAPVFSKRQRWIWTGDKLEDIDGSEVAWYVDFCDGRVYRSYFIFNSYYVRPVRSVE
ncbi:MAG: DUF1566 domain-containing protein, partial [Anaerolineales bacterium]|nr:DUF1566 domain-containing protein [Anaerolineales bacterium]